MVLYLSIIIGSGILIAILNIALNALPFFSLASLEFLGIAAATIIFEVLINGAVALIIHWLPKKWFLNERKIFKTFKWERRFFEKLGIKKWKDHVWELGGLGGFRKNKINDPTNPEYFATFLMESNKGIVVHIVSIFAGFVCILLFPQYIWTVGFPASLVGVFLNILPTLILRYNIPKLEIARERARRNKLKEEQNQTSEG